MDEEKNIIKDIIETGAEITGNLGGALVGGLLMGPVGVLVGGAGGPLISKVLKVVGLEMKQRIMGPREKIRIGATFTFAINKIIEQGKRGIPIRNDGFFEADMSYRSTAEEILEGVLLAAQKEHQERKVKYIGNLYGNIATHTYINREQANFLIKTAERLTYRQYCIIQLFYSWDRYNLNSLRKDAFIFNSVDISIEIGELVNIGLLNPREGSIYHGGDEGTIALSVFVENLAGRLFCQMLSLEEIADCEIKQVLSQMTYNYLDEPL